MAKAAHEQKLFHGKKMCQLSLFKYVDICTKGEKTVHTLQVQSDKVYRDEEKAEVLSSQYKSIFTVDNGWNCIAMNWCLLTALAR